MQCIVLNVIYNLISTADFTRPAIGACPFKPDNQLQIPFYLFLPSQLPINAEQTMTYVEPN